MTNASDLPPRRHRPVGVAAVTLLVLYAVAFPLQAQPARYEIDPDHLSIGFLVDHVGYSKVLGMFRAARGSYRFDEATGTLTDVRIEVDTASVFSNQRKRDEHLTGPDFLNAAAFPRMVFTAAKLAPQTGLSLPSTAGRTSFQSSPL